MLADVSPSGREQDKMMALREEVRRVRERLEPERLERGCEKPGSQSFLSSYFKGGASGQDAQWDIRAG